MYHLSLHPIYNMIDTATKLAPHKWVSQPASRRQVELIKSIATWGQHLLASQNSLAKPSVASCPSLHFTKVVITNDYGDKFQSRSISVVIFCSASRNLVMSESREIKLWIAFCRKGVNMGKARDTGY